LGGGRVGDRGKDKGPEYWRLWRAGKAKAREAQVVERRLVREVEN